MTGKTFIRFMALVIVLTAGIMMFSASGSNETAAKEECTGGKTNCTETKAQNELMLLESLSNRLFSATQ